MKSPAFQFYPADYLSDIKVQCLTSAQEGIYWRLVSYCWREKTLPREPEQLRQLCKPDASLNDISTVVERLFNTCANNASQITHARLDAEREKQDNRREFAREAGIKSGKSRAKVVQRKTNDRSVLVEPKSNSSSSSSTTVISEESENPKRARKPKTSKLTDEQWIDSLKADSKNAGLSIDAELAHMAKWCRDKNRTLSRLFANNWLKKSRAELPVSLPVVTGVPIVLGQTIEEPMTAKFGISAV